MKPRYAVIDQNERDNFEKEWQMPFGYNQCFVSFDPKEAVREIHYLVDQRAYDPDDMIVEKIDEDGRELYYRI